MSIIQKLIGLLDRTGKLRLVYLILLMSVGALLEAAGIWLIVPLISQMLGAEQANNQIMELVRFIPLSMDWSHNNFTNIVILMIFVFLLRGILVVYILKEQASLSFKFMRNLSTKLFSIYLKQPLEFFLNVNSAHLLRNVTGETNQVAGALIALSTLCSECLIFLSVFGLLLSADLSTSLYGTLFVGVLATAIFFLFSRRSNEWGKVRQVNEGLRLRLAQEGFNSIKEVKVIQKEKVFEELFDRANENVAGASRNHTVVQSLPRVIIESTLVMALLLAALISFSRGADLVNILPTLALFCAVALRMIPSINRIVTSAQTLKFCTVAIDKLHEEFARPLFDSNPPMMESKIPLTALSSKALISWQELKMTDVSYTYPGTRASVLQNINFSVLNGQIVGISGPSGSGKSTLINVLLALLEPNQGVYAVDGKPVNCFPSQLQSKMSYVPQKIFLTDQTLEANIAFGENSYNVNQLKLRNAIKAAALSQLTQKLEDGLKTIVGEQGARLSGGQCQRVGIARALYQNRDILVLDEATSALDQRNESKILSTLANLRGKKTIIMVTHNENSLSLCDRVYRMENGKISRSKGK